MKPFECVAEIMQKWYFAFMIDNPQEQPVSGDDLNDLPASANKVSDSPRGSDFSSRMIREPFVDGMIQGMRSCITNLADPGAMFVLDAEY